MNTTHPELPQTESEKQCFRCGGKLSVASRNYESLEYFSVVCDKCGPSLRDAWAISPTLAWLDYWLIFERRDVTALPTHQEVEGWNAALDAVKKQSLNIGLYEELMAWRVMQSMFPRLRNYRLYSLAGPLFPTIAERSSVVASLRDQLNNLQQLISEIESGKGFIETQRDFAKEKKTT